MTSEDFTGWSETDPNEVTVIRQVEANADDGQITTGTLGFDATYPYDQVGHHTNVGFKWFSCFMRFDNVLVPPGTIVSAYLKVKAFSTLASANVKSSIDAEDADDPATIISAVDWGNRVRTTAKINWDDIPAWTANTEYTSPDIKTIIQEIVERGGWASGQAMNIFWGDYEDQRTAAADKWRNTYGHEQDATKAPKLEITYETAGALTQSSTRSTFTALTRGGGLAYLTYDFGIDEIETFFVTRFTLLISDLDSADASNNVLGAIWGASNNAADPTVDPHIRIDVVENGADDSTYKLTLDISEVGGDNDAATSGNLDVGTIYYLQLVRTTFGDLCELSIYSDATYETLVEAITAEVFEFDDTFRYMFAPWKANYGTDVNDYMTGYVQDLVLAGAIGIAGFYLQDGNDITQQLALVALGDGVGGLGGIPRFRKGGVTYDIYLVNRGDGAASQFSLETTTGTRHIALFIPGEITDEIGFDEDGNPDGGGLVGPGPSGSDFDGGEVPVTGGWGSIYLIQINSENELTLIPTSVHYQQVNSENEVIMSPASVHYEQVNTEQGLTLSPSSTFANPVTAPEDFDLFTQVEEQAADVVTDQYHADLSLTQNETTYLYKDYGAGNLQGMTHDMQFKWVSGSGEAAIHLAANVVKGEQAMIDATDSHIMVYLDAGLGFMYVKEWDAVGDDFDGANITLASGTNYWLTITKAGLNYSVVVYDGPRRNNAIGTSTLVLQANYANRYLYIGNSKDDNTGGNVTFDADYLVV